MEYKKKGIRCRDRIFDLKDKQITYKHRYIYW